MQHVLGLCRDKANRQISHSEIQLAPANRQRGGPMEDEFSKPAVLHLTFPKKTQVYYMIFGCQTWNTHYPHEKIISE